MKLLHIILVIFLYPVANVIANTELPDPTRPATFIDQDLEPAVYEEPLLNEKISWKLSAIRISDKDKTAILNGKLVRAGDNINSAKVLEINPMSVVIDHEDRKLIVKLFKNKVIKAYKRKSNIEKSP